MKFTFFLFLAMLAAAPTVATAAAVNDGIKVQNVGKDGEERYYRVECRNGGRFQMTYYYKVPKVCFFPPKGKEVCRDTDDTDTTAREACIGR